MRVSLDELRPLIGEVVAVRRAAVDTWAVAIALLLFGGFFVLGTIAILKGPVGGRSAAWWTGAIALLLLAAAGLHVPKLLTTVVFGMQGAVSVRLGRVVRVLRYRELDEFRCMMQVRRAEGIYAGTWLNFRMLRRGHGSVVWAGKLREVSFWKRILRRASVDERPDEMMAVRFYIAHSMMEKMLQRLDAGESVRWGNGFDLHRKHLTPRRGRYKGQKIEYLIADRFIEEESGLAVFLSDESTPIGRVRYDSVNFWPAWMLYERLVEEANKNQEIQDEEHD